MDATMPKLGLVMCLMSSIVLMCTADWMVGGRSKIIDVETNKEVQELGKYCVAEFNRIENGNGEGDLTFTKVVEAETQVVAGVEYYLKIEAKKGLEDKMFESVVVVQPWEHSRQLIAFNPTTVFH